MSYLAIKLHWCRFSVATSNREQHFSVNIPPLINILDFKPHWPQIISTPQGIGYQRWNIYLNWHTGNTSFVNLKTLNSVFKSFLVDFGIHVYGANYFNWFANILLLFHVWENCAHLDGTLPARPDVFSALWISILVIGRNIGMREYVLMETCLH